MRQTFHSSKTKRTRKVKYTQLPYQKLFHKSTKPKVYLSAGYGAGKTHSLVMKILKLMAQNRGLRGGIVTPSYKMYKRDVLPTIQEICDDNHIPYQYNKTDHVFYFPELKFTLWAFTAEDDGKSIKGPNMAFMAINEVTLISKKAFEITLSRIRLKKAPVRQLVMSGTPEGFGWSYEYFIENPREDTDLIYGDMRLNRFAAEDYAKMLMESYDSKMVEQYVEGKFVNLRGNRAAWSFDRFKHVYDNIKKRPECVQWVSMDFNVDPMSATIYNRMPLGYKHTLEAWDEICIPNGNTYKMVEALRDKLSPSDEVVIFPDPAGKARTTATRDSRSDIAILKMAGFNEIRFKPKIASVMQCLNALNNLYDKNKILVSNRCRNFIADHEQCIIKPGTNEIDKSKPTRSHWLDGAKNMADYEFPVLRKPSFREYKFR